MGVGGAVADRRGVRQWPQAHCGGEQTATRFEIQTYSCTCSILSLQKCRPRFVSDLLPNSLKGKEGIIFSNIHEIEKFHKGWETVLSSFPILLPFPFPFPPPSPLPLPPSPLPLSLCFLAFPAWALFKLFLHAIAFFFPSWERVREILMALLEYSWRV